MAKAKAAWGIEVGNAAIKAVRLERDGSYIRVADFIVIPHPKVLTTPDLNIEEMLRMSLGSFAQQKSVEGAAVVMSVPGYDGLARFAKLPPIPKKAIPQTVLFEATQQIPFPLEEVEWDYHVFASDDSPEYEVGIFAILKEKIAQRLGLYKELGIRPSGMTLGPVAVYNAMMYDRDLGGGAKPVMAFLDIGTRATDLVVIQDGRCWIRTCPIGGHSFTESIVSAFSTPYGKADRHKGEAATHKHAKQLMHAMKPVFDDLLQEVQRSVGHHQSLNPGKPITQIIGLGSTFRIPGLRKFLSDQLRIEIRRLEDFERLKVEGSAASDFAANAINLSPAMGLALQGLGQSAININLSPVESLREQVWGKKTKWFVAAAGLVCAASAAMFWRPGGAVRPSLPSEITVAKSAAESKRKDYEEAKQAADLGARANNVMFMLEDRRVWPWIVADVNAALASVGPQEPLLGDIDLAAPPLPYDQWKIVELDDLRGRYKLASGGAAPKRTVVVAMQFTVPRDEKGAKEFVQSTVLGWFNKNADRPEAPYVIVIPEKGIVPTFGKASPDGSSGGGSGSGGTAVEEVVEEEAPTQESGAGAMSGRNRSDTKVTRARGSLGGSSGGGDRPQDAEFTGQEGSSGSGGASTSRRDRKASRVAVKSTAAEPVELDRDAPIPVAPRAFAVGDATAVTIRFIVELRAPVGRDLAPAPGAAEGGEPTEGEQQ
ncbi:MAG: pilus assembly protein PilM [Chloroflexota bacterium]